MCGKLYQSQSKIMEAGSCFYRASHIGQSILRKHSAVTISCTQASLTATENITITTRTDVFSRREEMLRFIIVACKHQCGETSEMVLKIVREKSCVNCLSIYSRVPSSINRYCVSKRQRQTCLRMLPFRINFYFLESNGSLSNRW